MQGFVAEIRLARGLVIAFLAIVVVASFAAVVIHRADNSGSLGSAQGGISTVTADDYELLALDSGVPVTRQLAISLCDDGDDADGTIHCLSTITKKPGATGPSPIEPFDADGSPAGGFDPSDLEGAYNIPVLTGETPPVVAVVVSYAYDAEALESDLADYRNQYDLEPCTLDSGCLRVLSQDGQAGAPTPTDSPSARDRQAWAQETALDVQMVSAACPTCKIAVYAASSRDLTVSLQAVKKAETDGAAYISMSFGSKVIGDTVAALDSQYFQDSGALYFAASGDNGYDEFRSEGKVAYPASSSRVIAVGGTSLYRDGTTDRGWKEYAWSGSGSVCAWNAPRLTPQEDIVSAPFPAGGDDAICPGRAVADISAVASTTTPVVVRQGGRWLTLGGTSAASPLVAGIYAAAYGSDGFAGGTAAALQHIYENPRSFNDVRVGATGSCSGSPLCVARPGWDGPTGVGTPDGNHITASEGAGDESSNSNFLPPKLDVAGGDFDPETGVVSATLAAEGDTFSLNVKDFGDYERIDFNVTLVDDSPEQNVVSKCTASADLGSIGLNLNDCILHGMIDIPGDYTVSVTKDADGNLVVTVIRKQDPPGSGGVDCDADPDAAGCGTPPDCEADPDAAGCGTPPDCDADPDAAGCGTPPDCDADPGAAGCGTPPDCDADPGAAGCDTPPDCDADPEAAGCDTPPDCDADPEAAGCDDPPAGCEDDPEAEGCEDPPAGCEADPEAAGCDGPPADCEDDPTAPACVDPPAGCEADPEAAGCDTPPNCDDDSTAPDCQPDTNPPSGPNPPSSGSHWNGPAGKNELRRLTVTVKIILQGLVLGGSDAEPDAAGPLHTVLSDVGQGGEISPMAALSVLSELPPVVGLTPAYTPQNVLLIRMAKLVRALVPFPFA